MGKLLISDIDGTLLSGGIHVHEEVKNAIKRWRKAGNHLVLATGRLYPATRYYVDDLGEDLYTITCSGAAIYQGGKLVKEYELPHEMILELWQRCLEEGIYAQIYHDQGIVFNSEDRVSKFYSSFASLYGEEYAINTKCLKDISSALKEPVHKFSTITHHPEEEPLVQSIVKKYPQVHAFKSSQWMTDVIHESASKGKALEWIRNHTDYDGYYAIGDHENDISMIQAADIGAAMGNAPDHVKEVANKIVAKNTEHGLAEFIEYLLSLDE